jgi:hypothetical protein
MRTIRSISPGSVFKVTFVVYAILFAIFGCLFILLPGILGVGTGMMTGVLGERGRALAAGGGVVVVVIVYVAGIFIFAFVQSIIAAIGALFYNIVAGLVGGIKIDLGN